MDLRKCLLQYRDLSAERDSLVQRLAIKTLSPQEKAVLVERFKKVRKELRDLNIKIGVWESKTNFVREKHSRLNSLISLITSIFRIKEKV